MIFWFLGFAVIATVIAAMAKANVRANGGYGDERDDAGTPDTQDDRAQVPADDQS